MSEVKTNKISPRSGTTLTLGDASDVFQLPASAEIDVASGATLDVNGTLDVTGATVSGLTTGKVVQLVSAELAGTTGSTTSTSYIDTGLNVAITPTASTSKIVVLVYTLVYSVTSTTAQYSAQIIENGSSTVLCEFVNSGISGGTTHQQQISMGGVFSCSGTSELTFKTQMHKRSNSDTLYYLGYETGSKHTIIAIEVAA